MSAAAAVLRKRAVSCSFSSIYHLPKAGFGGVNFNVVDRVVRSLIILPCVLGGSLVLFSAARLELDISKEK